jgi:hypothetical protein
MGQRPHGFRVIQVELRMIVTRMRPVLAFIGRVFSSPVFFGPLFAAPLRAYPVFSSAVWRGKG